MLGIQELFVLLPSRCDEGSTKKSRMPEVSIAFAADAERLDSDGGSGKNRADAASSEDLTIAVMDVTSETTYSQKFE